MANITSEITQLVNSFKPFLEIKMKWQPSPMLIAYLDAQNSSEEDVLNLALEEMKNELDLIRIKRVSRENLSQKFIDNLSPENQMHLDYKNFGI
jgi:hypothetical protein